MSQRITKVRKKLTNGFSEAIPIGAQAQNVFLNDGTILQDVIEELQTGHAGHIDLTQAEYTALPYSKKNDGTVYFVTDGQAGANVNNAAAVVYNNNTTGLTSTNVQGAIDEVYNTLENTVSQVDANASDIEDIQSNIVGGYGTEIAEGTNLNSLTEFGRYYSPNATRTNTLVNKPIGLPGAAFLLEVDTAGAWNRQTISSGHNTYPVKYVRNFYDTNFSPWNRIQEHAVSNNGVIDLTGIICVGHLTSSQTIVYFSIPLQGLKGGVSDATLSGSYVIRSSTGGYIGVYTGQTLQSLGTVSVTVNPNNVYVGLTLKTAATFPNNSMVSVHCLSGASLTLS